MFNERLYKNIIIFFTAVLGFWVMGALGLVKKEIKNIDSKGTAIVCFGDSLTFGYGVTAEYSYPAWLAKMINRPVINLGVDGQTSVEALKRVEADLNGKDPLLVIVEFCGNDFLEKVPKEETGRNIQKIVDYAQSIGAMAAVVDVSAGMLMGEYRPLFYNIAKTKKAIFIPGILSGIITNPHLKSDFVHPNSEGYNIIAQRVYRSILPYLNQNSLLRRYKK